MFLVRRGGAVAVVWVFGEAEMTSEVQRRFGTPKWRGVCLWVMCGGLTSVVSARGCGCEVWSRPRPWGPVAAVARDVSISGSMV